MQTLKTRPIRLDAAPTEVQMKLAIAQVLSLPFAYNSPVIILDFEVGDKVEGTIAHDYLSNRWGSTAQMQRQQGNAPKEGAEQRMGETLYKVKGGEWEAVEGAKTLKEREELDHFNDDGDWTILRRAHYNGV